MKKVKTREHGHNTCNKCTKDFCNVNYGFITVEDFLLKF